MQVNTLLTHVTNTIFPPRCFSCNSRVQQQGMLCSECWRDIQFITAPQCLCCGYPFASHESEAVLCGECQFSRPLFRSARSAMRYNQYSARLITRFKYGDHHTGIHMLSQWMINVMTPIPEDIDLIVPVPIHRFKLLTRHYNQSALLALSLHQQTHIPVLPQALVRHQHTPPQASLSRKARLTNVKKAFKVNSRYSTQLHGKHVLLVDDVFTTGATLHACCRALKKAKVASIDVVTIARTVL